MVPTSAFCRFLKQQAILSEPPHCIYLAGRCPSSILASRNIVETPPGLDEPRLRDGVTYGDTIYYTIRLHGDRKDHPTRANIRVLQTELADIMQQAGVEEMPIACNDDWKADDWERMELERFDEVVPSGHAQDARAEQQKYQRTNGDVVLVYPFPASKIGDLCKAMGAVEEYRQAHCGAGVKF